MTGQFFCQLYDTESECDGLVSYDRAVWKVDAGIVNKAARGQLRPEELETANGAKTGLSARPQPSNP